MWAEDGGSSDVFLILQCHDDGMLGATRRYKRIGLGVAGGDSMNPSIMRDAGDSQEIELAQDELNERALPKLSSA